MTHRRSTESWISICRVVDEDGERDYATCLSHDLVFAGGLIPEAIVGIFSRLRNPGEALKLDLGTIIYRKWADTTPSSP